MSYIPDYRKETDKLNKEDQLYIQGYRQAVSDMQNFFDSRDEDYTMVDEVVENVKSELAEYMVGSEIELVCAIFDEADYLPDDIELIDGGGI